MELILNSNFTLIENDKLNIINGGGLGETICTGAGGAVGVVYGAKWGAEIGWLGGPAGSVLGAAAGAAVGYGYYHFFM